ncbi:WGR domain-containing protein [Sphingosinithalassobacter sp. CS137]|uniref:WGR domain-containing protein n=1 Tax=Sphingosinithalassobacter sp. CS137 TaxID=2762748 RepID=UPI00165D5536|nr:WGR domain-containing protein [Sphingosinithalassobacter sp. CS137]
MTPPALHADRAGCGGSGRNDPAGWSVAAQHDLFGMIAIVTRWGRPSRPGQQRKHGFSEHGEAERFVRNALARRRSAPRRIGLYYRAPTDMTDRPNTEC